MSDPETLTFEIVYEHLCTNPNSMPNWTVCLTCGAVPFPTPSGKVGVRWLLPIEPQPREEMLGGMFFTHQGTPRSIHSLIDWLWEGGYIYRARIDDLVEALKNEVKE